jgi:growth hormone-inducible transmembrane protein
LYNIWLYGGLLLISAYTLHDVQKIIHNAKSKATWDPVNESLDIYLDAIIMFKRFLMIFINN